MDGLIGPISIKQSITLLHLKTFIVSVMISR